MRQHAEAAQAVCAVAAFAVACAARQTPAQRPTPKPEKVHRPPLKQLVLFRSGVGFFEHRAEVEGNATLELEFHVEEINDVLKSMTAEDLGGGRISAVRYGSRAPVGRLTVTSPKTARYGKTSRIVPIFPELRPYLQEAWDAADEGEQWVVPMLEGKPDKNLGTTFKKIIARAGLEGWVKPFQNLRASRQTELEQTYPTYVVCKWLGNTPNVARKHYLTVTEDHFRAAAGGQTGDKRGTQQPAATRMKKPGPP